MHVSIAVVAVLFICSNVRTISTSFLTLVFDNGIKYSYILNILLIFNLFLKFHEILKEWK